MFQHKIYHTNKGVVMGSPISSKIAEIFIQHYGNTYIKQILNIKNLQYYTSYVDILIIYDSSKITHESITQQINQIHKDIKFNPTYETNNTINFLDLKIMRNTQNVEISIYRKPTTTDTTIHHASNHPMEHKTAAYRYYLSWMHSLPLNPDEKQKPTIAKNNGFPIQHFHRINQQIQHNNNKPHHHHHITTNKNKNFHVLQPTHMNNNQPIQTHKFTSNIQDHKHRQTTTPTHHTQTQNRT